MLRSMRYPLWLLSGLLASDLGAQVLVATAAVGGAHATIGGASQVTLQAGLAIPPTRTVTNAGGSDFARSVLSFSNSPYEHEVVISQETRATGPTGHSAGTLGYVLLTLTTSRHVEAVLEFRLNHGTFSSGSHMSGRIDIGNDGSHELTISPWVFQATLPLSLPAGTTPIALVGQCSSATSILIGNTWFSYDLVFRVVPTETWTTQTQPSCGPGSPHLVSQPAFGGVEFVMTNLNPPATTIGALVLGFAGTNLPLALPPGCTLGCRPDAVGLVFPDVTGAAVHLVDVRSLLPGTDLFAQTLGLDFGTGILRTSERVQLTIT